MDLGCTRGMKGYKQRQQRLKTYYSQTQNMASHDLLKRGPNQSKDVMKELESSFFPP